MYTYIQKDVDNTYVELSFLLDENYKVGDTWESYLDGSWVLLTEEQLAFKEANKKASVLEVFDMQLTEYPEIKPSPEDELRFAKNKRLKEAYTLDANSNVFNIVKGTEKISLWLDKNTRNSLLNITIPAEKAKGNVTTTLWYEGSPYNGVSPIAIMVPITWVEENLPVLEIYAKQTYDILNKNLSAILSAKTVAEVNFINIKDAYPSPITFTFSEEDIAATLRMGN